MSEALRAALERIKANAGNPEAVWKITTAALAQPPAPTAQQCTCPSGDGSLRWPCPQHPAPTAQPADDDWKHLLPFGYAPGNYMGICKGCSRSVDFLDKRALHCRRCAEKLHAAAQPVQQPGAEAAKKLVNEFGRACAFGNDETRVRAGDALVAALLAAPAQRQPLPPFRVSEILIDAGYNFSTPEAIADFINGLRHGEAAHGIAAQKGEKL